MAGPNAVKLELPPKMNLYPVLNVALLKRYHGQYLLLNLILVDHNAEYEVEEILKHYRHPCYFYYVLRWKGYGPEEDIWVPEADLEHTH